MELEVVPFDLKVVAHAIDVVPFGRAAVANQPVTSLLACVPPRACAKSSRSIRRKDYADFR
jgi:hypothetical protein